MEESRQNIKDSHIRACLTEEVESPVSPGFERIRLRSGFPDFSYSDIDTKVEFLGKPLHLPLLISPLTGGGNLSRQINRRLARAADTLGIGMAVGSQKLMLDNLAPAASYLVRDLAPQVPLLANLGLVHVKKGRDYLLKAVESLSADGLILYVNTLQEVLQDGGERDFRGLLTKLDEIVSDFPCPVLLKEVGAGLPEALMKWAGMRKGIVGIDVAGLGGTNWARIEGLMSDHDYQLYGTLGSDTVETLLAARQYVRDDQYLIASGGIRNGIDMAKALALGADLVSIGLPFLRWASQSRPKIIEGVDTLRRELQVAMWFTGSSSIGELRGKYTVRN